MLQHPIQGLSTVRLMFLRLHTEEENICRTVLSQKRKAARLSNLEYHNQMLVHARSSTTFYISVEERGNPNHSLIDFSLWGGGGQVPKCRTVAKSRFFLKELNKTLEF